MNVRDIYGISHKQAVDLKKFYNIRNVNTLRAYVRKIPHIISKAQYVGVKYHDKIHPHITLQEAKYHVDYIKKHIPDAIAVGPFRREEKKIREITIITTRNLENSIKKINPIQILSTEDDVVNIIIKVRNIFRRIELIRVTREEKPFALLYHTGDYVQNVNMHRKAKRMGYDLSSTGLVQKNKNILLPTERDIFDFLRISYKEPNERSHSKIL